MGVFGVCEAGPTHGWTSAARAEGVGPKLCARYGVIIRDFGVHCALLILV